MDSNTIQVLDKGYVRLTDSMGSDLTPVNAARVSYMKESRKLTDKDKGLINFLVKHAHTSPFRHAILQFEIKAPIMVARQWFKYRVGSEHGPDTAEITGTELPREVLEWLIGGNGDDSGFNDRLYARNEASRRYVTLEPEFYVPEYNEWRSKPANSKQGSGEPVAGNIGNYFTVKLQDHIKASLALYEAALKDNICAEQARLFLPYAGMYTIWRWTASFPAVIHFLEQRLGDDAQQEIQSYAVGVLEVIKDTFPLSIEALMRKSLPK